jgi:polar amino acid transport system substrate-binding protein
MEETMFAFRSALLTLMTSALVAGCVSLGEDEKLAAAKQQLAPTGKIRAAISVGPSGSQFRAKVVRGSDPLRGVPVDLANALGAKVGVPVDLVPYDNYVELLEAGRLGAWDVTFLPFSEERAKIIDYGPAYYFLEVTYIVPAGSAIRNQGDIDRPGIRVAAVEGSISAVSLQQSLKSATFVQLKKLAEIREQVAAKKVDVAAAGRETLVDLATQLPGARVLEDNLYALPVSVAVPKSRPAALAYVSEFIETAKATGVVRRAFDNAGFKDAAVAPLASRQ